MRGNGLAFIPVDKIPQKDNVVIEETVQESGLSSYIQKVWERNRDAKHQKTDERLLDCLRAKKGEYKPSDLKDIKEQGGSQIYMMLTNTKIRGLKAWMRDVLISPNDKPWSVSPTAMPDLPNYAEQAIAQRMQQTTMNDESYRDVVFRVSKLRDSVLKALKEDAKKRAGRMETKIQDQLEEAKFEEDLDKFLDDFATFPGALIKGPVSHKRATLKWEQDENGNSVPVKSEEIIKEFHRLSPFDAYPSPNAETPNDGSFIERIRLSRKEILSFIDVDEGYSNKAINDVLEEYGSGGLRQWLWIDNERAILEGKDNWWMQNQEGTLDGIHFWGSVQGKSLTEWGVKDKNIKPLCEYEIDAIKIGRHIIRCVVSKDPLKRRPYHKACFDPIPGSFWGNALSELIDDNQRMCNATARAISNNVGMASGPMIEVHYDRLAPGENIDVYPWKVWQTERGDSSTNSQNINFFQPKLNAHELLRVYEEFERRADDASGVPRYSYGNERVGGAGRTSSGLAMLMSSASRGVKSAISQVDLYVIRPIIEQLYFYNMIEDSDPLIKGDVKVVAKGATALLVKEQAHQQRLEFLQVTANPLDMEILGKEGRAKILREHVKVLDMQDIIPEDEEFNKAEQEQQAQQQQQQPQDPALLKLQQDGEHFNKKMEFENKKLSVDAKKSSLSEEVEAKKIESENERHNAEIESKERIERLRIKEEAENKRYIEKVRAEEDKEKEGREETADDDSNNAGINKIMDMIMELKEKENNERGDIILNIDAKSGAVNKRIKITDRDDNGQLKELETSEV